MISNSKYDDRHKTGDADVTKHRVPQLRSLGVNIELGMPRNFPLIFEDVPALTHLSLGHLGNWRTDWSLLTELELSREFNVGQLLRVLSQTTNLVQLGFNRLITNPEQLGKNNFEPVTLPRLRTLEISGHAILQFLTTPALQGLYVHNSREEPVDKVCASFFTRSSCRLQRYGTGAVQLWPCDFANILPYMPDLKVLSVCDPAILRMPEFMKAMTCRTGEQPLMPQLRVLRISFDDVGGFKKMLESRSSDRFRDQFDEFRHCNVQSRQAENDFSYAMPTQFRWLRDDLDC
ncbi:hypothetical protein JOM56_012517 [Amanita muscaria]